LSIDNISISSFNVYILLQQDFQLYFAKHLSNQTNNQSQILERSYQII